MIHLLLQGGLGNQLFEVAIARYYSIKWNEDITLDISRFTSDKNEYRNYELSAFNLPPEWKILTKNGSIWNRYGIKYYIFALFTKFYIHSCFFDHYKGGGKFGKIYQFVINNILGYYRYHIYSDFAPLKRCKKKHIYFTGDWLWPEIVEEQGEKLREILRVKRKLNENNRLTLEQINSSNSVGVHIRRGDYVRLGLVVCSIAFYEHCIDEMANIVDNPTFFIFSDDIQWVKDNLKSPHKILFVDNSNPATEDLRLLYSCKHFIMSNSTFSWWGAYLGYFKEKKIIAPKYWVANSKYMDPLIRSNMILIDNQNF